MRKMTQAEFNALKRNENGYLVIPDCTDCTEIDFGAANKVIFGKGCKLGNWCELGYGCRLGNGCKLGEGCRLGNCCELGYGCRLGNGCKLGDECRLGNGCELGYVCELGYECRLGECCDLGSWCKLGDGCKLGYGCELGYGCKLGEYIDARATFEGGRVQDGLYVQIGNIGSEHRTAYFYIDKDGAMFVRAGCWFSGMEDFKARVKDVHGGTIYEAQYMAACAYAETVLPQMLKKSDAARKEQHDNQ